MGNVSQVSTSHSATFSIWLTHRQGTFNRVLLVGLGLNHQT